MNVICYLQLMMTVFRNKSSCCFAYWLCYPPFKYCGVYVCIYNWIDSYSIFNTSNIYIDIFKYQNFHIETCWYLIFRYDIFVLYFGIFSLIFLSTRTIFASMWLREVRLFSIFFRSWLQISNTHNIGVDCTFADTRRKIRRERWFVSLKKVQCLPYVFQRKERVEGSHSKKNIYVCLHVETTYFIWYTQAEQ